MNTPYKGNMPTNEELQKQIDELRQEVNRLKKKPCNPPGNPYEPKGFPALIALEKKHGPYLGMDD